MVYDANSLIFTVVSLSVENAHWDADSSTSAVLDDPDYTRCTQALFGVI